MNSVVFACDVVVARRGDGWPPRGGGRMHGRLCPSYLAAKAMGSGRAQEFRQGAGVTCRVQIFRRPPVSRNSCSGPKYPPRVLYSTTFACVPRPSMGRGTQAKVVRCIPRRDIARAHRLVPPGGEALVLDDGPRSSSSASNPRRRLEPSSAIGFERPRVPQSGPPRCGDGPALVSTRRIERAGCPKRRRLARATCSAMPKAPGHRMVSWRCPGHRSFNLLRFGHIRPDSSRQSTPPARRPHRNNQPLRSDA